MERFVIDGKRTLSGEVNIHGAKNAALPVLCACILCDEKVVLHNCPRLSDVDNTIEILRFLGCGVERFEDTVRITPSGNLKSSIPKNLMNKMRSSIIFLGPLLAKLGNAQVCLPGGCELGPRPIDIHLNSLKKLNINVDEHCGEINCKSDRIKGTSVNLPFPSVGATENIILATVVGNSVTLIHNAAREPEIIELQNFLNKCGADISGAGGNCIKVNGVSSLKGCEYSILPDRIEASTYMSFAAVTGSRITLNNICNEHIEPVVFAFREAGCEMEFGENKLTLTAPKKLNRINHIKTLVYPGFPTDSGMPIIAMSTLSKGTTVFEETIFQNRYNATAQLNKMGADIKVYDRIAIIEGVEELYGTSVSATDLRGGAALVCAGLAAKGKTIVTRLDYIDRGYEKLEYNLSLLGADIKREYDNERKQKKKEIDKCSEK